MHTMTGSSSQLGSQMFVCAPSSTRQAQGLDTHLAGWAPSWSPAWCCLIVRLPRWVAVTQLLQTGAGLEGLPRGFLQQACKCCQWRCMRHCTFGRWQCQHYMAIRTIPEPCKDCKEYPDGSFESRGSTLAQTGGLTRLDASALHIISLPARQHQRQDSCTSWCLARSWASTCCQASCCCPGPCCSCCCQSSNPLCLAWSDLSSRLACWPAPELHSVGAHEPCCQTSAPQSYQHEPGLALPRHYLACHR